MSLLKTPTTSLNQRPMLPLNAAVSCRKKHCTLSLNKVRRASKRPVKKPVNSKLSIPPDVLISLFRSNTSIPSPYHPSLFSFFLGTDLRRKGYLRHRICLLLQRIYNTGAMKMLHILCCHSCFLAPSLPVPCQVKNSKRTKHQSRVE